MKLNKIKFKTNKFRLGKKSLLFSILVFILLFSIFSFAGLYSILVSEKQSYADLSNSRMSYFEDDILSNAFFELARLRIANIARGSDLVISFDQLLMNSSFQDYPAAIQNYVSFVETDYSILNNLDIALEAFNGSFEIMPYHTIAVIGRSNTNFYTMQNSTNYVKSISITIKASETRAGNCQSPNEDPGQIPVTVTFIDKDGWTCTKSVYLNPLENNDKGPDNRQFLLDFDNGGDVEVKYGLLNGNNGVFRISQNSVAINITNLEITYSALPEKTLFYNGQIRIINPIDNTTKQTDIVLAQE